MDTIISTSQCTGCGACINSCPKKAINMRIDTEGFEQAIINQNLCVDCGLCKIICPLLHYEDRESKQDKDNSIQKGYAARNTNIEERFASSSGSIFPVLAHRVIEDGGIIVGIAYDDKFNAAYRIVDKHEDLHFLQGSKYLQCKVDNETFPKIKCVLHEGRKVLFTGLACQVEGLKSYLRKDYDNLYCVDLICMGIPSAYIWQLYLKTYFKGEQIKDVNFKEKSEGWNHFNLSIKTDKRNFRQWGMINPYFKSMFNTYNMRQSCFVCPFKKLQRAADITLADCWGANKLVPEIDDNKGLSSVIIHSKKGMSLWESVSDEIEQKELPLDEIVKGNMNMVQNRTCNNEERIEFYSLINSNKIKKAFRFAEMHGANTPPTLKQKIKNIIKKFLCRI